MGFSFSGIHRELSSERFSRFYEELRTEFTPLQDYPTPFSLISFFHDRSRDYKPKDAILFFLFSAYQQDRRYLLLAPLFIALFAPAIIAIYRLARKRDPSLDEEELIQEVCANLLETIKETKFTPVKVAAQIVGRLKNKTRRLINESSKKDRREGFTAIEDILNPDEICDPLENMDDHETSVRQEDSGERFDIPDAEAFLGRLLWEGVINEKDKMILTATIIEGRPLRDISSSPSEYQRLKKRRQRALLAIRKAKLNLHKHISKSFK